MHIVLADIDPMLFPDYYPFYKDFFKKEKMYLASKEEKSEIGIANIKYIVKLVRKSQSIQDTESRGFVRYLYEKWVDKTYDWFRPYTWSDVSKIKKNDMTKMSLSLGCNHSCHVRHKSKNILPDDKSFLPNYFPNHAEIFRSGFGVVLLRWCGFVDMN